MDSPIRQLLARAEREMQARNYAAATQLLLQVLAIDSGNVVALAHLGVLGLMQGDFANAETYLRAACAVNPAHPGVSSNLAVLLRSTNRLEEALALQKQLVAHEPNNASNHYNLANTLLQLHEYDAAIAAYHQAIRLAPHHAAAMTNLARAYRLALRESESMDWMNRAAAIDATPLSWSNLIFASTFAGTESARSVASLGEDWDRRFGAPLRANATAQFANPRDPERVLHIGYAGSIFRSHPVGLLIEPLLAQHDRKAFRVFCYGDVHKPDDITDRLRKSVDVYRDSVRMSDGELAEQIRRDQIDILVDLNLHMSGSRLTMMARRAAPLQVNYLAYPFASGVATMDYRVTDTILDPPGCAAYGPEKLIRLSHCFWLYRPDPLAIAPADDLPARLVDHITFASLNDTRKLNSRVVQAWSQILGAVPNSRLLLRSDNPPSQRAHIEGLFAAHGLAPERIDLVGTEPHHAHLNRYLTVDLCLDPFPYGGHTTTLDALWMGVPTLTLAGEAACCRGSASILSRVGLGELVMRSVEEYVELSTSLARNLDRLRAIRANLRERMCASQLCDEGGFARELEAALRTAWRRYCAGLPAADLNS
jgi:predicted O-linked N-acetylglucosamine transferase (SPINDLY family)